MNRSLGIAILGALMGFGGWIWLAGPGSSVLNAIVALVCALIVGRAAWWVADRVLSEGEVQPPAAPPPPPKGRRAPPPADAAPWRRPEGAD